MNSMHSPTSLQMCAKPSLAQSTVNHLLATYKALVLRGYVTLMRPALEDPVLGRAQWILVVPKVVLALYIV